MSILLTNDDGIDAPGLRALFETITNFVANLPESNRHEIIVVAPDRGRSECGHSVTTGRDLSVTEREPGWHAVDGTPVDCVRVATALLCPNPRVVFSGVNAGANVGVDLLVSGTFAAAREAAVQGIPACAISHYRKPDVPKTWNHVSRWLQPVLQSFADAVPWPTEIPSKTSADEAGKLWNVNLPAVDPDGNVPQLVHCHVERLPMERTGTFAEAFSVDLGRPRPMKMQSDFHGRARSPGSDVERCFSGDLTISELNPYPH